MGNCCQRKHIPRKMTHRVYASTEGCCFYCGTSLGKCDHRRDRWQIDHHYPRRYCGSDSESNYVPACLSCNAKKKAKYPTTFAMQYGLRPRCWHRDLGQDTFCVNRVHVSAELYCTQHRFCCFR